MTRHRPEAFDVGHPELEIEPELILDDEPVSLPAIAAPPRKGWRWGRVLTAALGGLVTLALGLWVDEIVRGLFARYEPLGWFGLALAALALIGFVGLLARELAGLWRLRRLHDLRDLATRAHATDQAGLGRRLAKDLIDLYASRPETAGARRLLERHAAEIVDGRDLVAMAERDLLTPLDAGAKALVLSSAKRVSVVTAASPRALIDLAFVGFEALRLARRIATLYGGRPGTLGMARLVREVVAHLIVTGGLAVGDGVLAGVLGHGLAGRVSARLGEGVVNGVLTARVGVATMAVCRPVPFLNRTPPSVREIAGGLVSRAGTERKAEKVDRVEGTT